MKVVVTKLPKSQVKLEIEVSPEKLAQFQEAAVQKMNAKVKLDGFREGKVPYDILIQHFGQDAFRSFLIDAALPKTFSDAVINEKLEVVSYPKINLLSEEPLKYEALVAIHPEVLIPHLESIQIEKKEVSVSDEEVSQLIEDLLKRKAVFNPITRAVQKGDRVEINFKGHDENGKEIEGLISKNHPLIVGDGMFYQGFEDELIGLSIGDKKEFSVIFDKEYHYKPFREKTYKFEVELLKLDESILPDLDEKFISSIFAECSTIEQFRVKLSEQLKFKKEEDEQKRRRDAFIETLLMQSSLEVPELLVEDEKDYIIDLMMKDFGKKGIKREQVEQFYKEKNRDMRKEAESEAESRVRARFILEKAFSDAQIEVLQTDIDSSLADIKKHYSKEEYAKFDSLYKVGNPLYNRLIGSLKVKKILDKYVCQ